MRRASWPTFAAHHLFVQASDIAFLMHMAEHQKGALEKAGQAWRTSLLLSGELYRCSRTQRVFRSFGAAGAENRAHGAALAWPMVEVSANLFVWPLGARIA